ncbi:MAG: hypothetical protein ACYC8T_33270, partial [Myxococcaceae bacterium]
YHEGDGETESTYVANVYYRSEANAWTFNVAPFFFAGEDPLHHHLFLPPLVWSWGGPTSSTFIAGPVFTHQEKDGWDTGVLPLWIGGRHGNRRYNVVPPLLLYHSSDGADSTLFAINTYYSSHGDDYSLAALPLVFAGREGAKSHLVVAPLYWDFRDQGSRTFVAANFFQSEDATGWDAGFVPFWFGGRHGSKAYDLVPPLVFRQVDGDRTRLTVLPLFDYLESKTGKQFLSPLFVYSADQDHERTVALGLYWRFQGPDADAQVVFPFWWDFKNNAKQTRLTTVFPLYWRYEKPDETTHLLLNVMWSSGKTALGPSWSFHLFPFVDLASYNPEHFLWQVLAGMVGGEQQGNLHRSRIAWVWTEPRRSGE